MIPVRWAIPHLCGLQQSVRDDRRLLMLRAFFDESNKNRGDGHFVMAGWVASVLMWEKFTQTWQEALSADPQIKYFKASEANSLSGEFATFTHAKRDQKRLALSHAIASADLRGYIVTADHRIIENKPNGLNKLVGTRLYDWAFMATVSTVLQEHIERGETAKIDFVFDGCTELRACIENYESRKSHYDLSMRHLAGEVIPGDDRELAGLQAADLLAGEVSAGLKSKEYGEAYRALAQGLHQLVYSPAQPPPALQMLWVYAHEVEARQKVLADILQFLKERGIKLNDLI